MTQRLDLYYERFFIQLLPNHRPAAVKDETREAHSRHLQSCKAGSCAATFGGAHSCSRCQDFLAFDVFKATAARTRFFNAVSSIF
jgi:hypothetical protein